MRTVFPSINEHSFNCPYCGTLARQFWRTARAADLPTGARVPELTQPDEIEELVEGEGASDPHRELLRLFYAADTGGRLRIKPIANRIEVRRVSSLHFSECYACGEVALWLGGRLIYPQVMAEVPMSPDTPEHIRREYEEAASIAAQSPRAAAALLRLAIEKLCQHICGNTKKVNANIEVLENKGLNKAIVDMLDIVRVIGNHALHDGQIDLDDDPGATIQLFHLFNRIVEKTITEPAADRKLYSLIPPQQLAQIERRRAKKSELD